MTEAVGTWALSCVALVDDNDFDNEYATIMLRKAGYSGDVLVYESGEQALAALLSTPPSVDLLFLDINMPGMNGFEVAERLSDLPTGGHSTIIVMLTSSSNPAEVRRALDIPAVTHVITKPLTVDKILDIVAGIASSGAR
jgi:CheY-like chemotaxis protein